MVRSHPVCPLAYGDVRKWKVWAVGCLSLHPGSHHGRNKAVSLAKKQRSRLSLHSGDRHSLVSFGIDGRLHRLHRIQPYTLHDLTEYRCGLAAYQLDAGTVCVSV